MTNPVYPTSFLPYQVGKQRPPNYFQQAWLPHPWPETFNRSPFPPTSADIPVLPEAADGSPTLTIPSTSLPTPTYDAYLPTVLIANVCSLASRIDELTIVAHVNDVDFICLTESWLSQSIPDSALSLSNFIVFRNDRAVASGGGVCVYISSSIKCRRIKEFENPLVESLRLSVRPRYLPRSISVILLSPSSYLSYHVIRRSRKL